ncbi:MAG: transporter [Nitrospirae bacterium]|nr:transporter [Nitrospirota bacterium]
MPGLRRIRPGRICLSVSVIGLFLVSVPESSAQGPPIQTDTALITGFSVAARSFLQVIEKSGDLPGGEEGRLSAKMLPIMLPYQIRPNHLVLIAAMPYMDMDLKIKNGPTLSNSGWGDLRLLAEYNLYQKDAPRLTTRAILIGGVKLSTAEDDKSGLPPPMQLGTGSTDYTVGTAVSRIGHRLGYYSDLKYTIKNKGNGYEFGDTLNYDLAVGYRLLPGIYESYPAKQLNLFLELNGLYAQKDRSNGQKVHDSGGHSLFLSPGIQFIPLKTALFEASVQIPIFQDLNGDQLKTDYTYLIGFRWLLY